MVKIVNSRRLRKAGGGGGGQGMHTELCGESWRSCEPYCTKFEGRKVLKLIQDCVCLLVDFSIGNDESSVSVTTKLFI
jgi:hypothetical protein